MSEEIKSQAYSNQGRKNHELIFTKKSAHEWAEINGDKIIDFDGWNWKDGITTETPITYSEYQKRLPYCTIYWINPDSIQKGIIK